MIILVNLFKIYQGLIITIVNITNIINTNAIAIALLLIMNITINILLLLIMMYGIK